MRLFLERLPYRSIGLPLTAVKCNNKPQYTVGALRPGTLGQIVSSCDLHITAVMISNGVSALQSRRCRNKDIAECRMRLTRAACMNGILKAAGSPLAVSVCIG
jgi:hypothetical protein